VTSLEVTFNRNDETSCIGHGGFGRIYKGEWHGQAVAVKEMHWEDARALDRQDLKDIHREISIWSRLAHPHILPFYCACLESAQPFMVTKLCAHGNALQFLRAFPQADRIYILYEIALGMNYLHIQGIIHADLKASNVLIADDGKALISDFGLSRFQDHVSSGRSTVSISLARTHDGSLRWMAPERLDGNPPDRAADVYSFAITAWELFTGSVPFSHVPDRALARKVVDKNERPERPVSMENEPLWDVVQHCWNPEPARRPAFDGVHARLKSFLNQCANSFLVVPAISSDTPTTPSSVPASNRAASLHPGLDPVPPSPSLLSFETLNLGQNDNDNLSPGEPQNFHFAPG
jgi:serine/threonine protein kinase